MENVSPLKYCYQLAKIHNVITYNTTISALTILKIPSCIYFKFFTVSILLVKNISFDLCFLLCECLQWYPVHYLSVNPSSFKCFFISAFSLLEYSGVMSAETETNGSVVCLSLTYYLQPNSGAVIKVLMENEYNEVTVGKATALLGDIQVMDDIYTLHSEAANIVPQLGHDHFLLNSIKFIIH